MAIELPDARQLSDETLQQLRLRPLRGIELGYSEVQLAELLGVSNVTISHGWTCYQAHGLDALPAERTGRPLGSGRFLTDEQAHYVQVCLNSRLPQDWAWRMPCGPAAPWAT